MADLPYVINTGKISDYFERIQEVGKPPAVTHQWIQALGFKSSNDRYLLAFLKDIGFLDASGKPTQRWTDFRHTVISRSAMASAVRQGYAGLFDLYQDAHLKDDEAIRNWMRTHAPNASPTTVDRSLSSFRGICKLADFGVDGAVSMPGSAPSTEIDPKPPSSSPTASLGGISQVPTGPSIHINVELHLPASASAEDYEAFFSAMRKHLFDGSTTAG